MYYYEVAPTKIIRQDTSTFTYHYESPLSVGSIVTVPVGKQLVTGVVTEAVNKPTYQTKAVNSVIEDTPLPTELLKSLLWISMYYATPLATVLSSSLPRGLRKKRRAIKPATPVTNRDRTNIVFNDDQAAALKKIQSGGPATYVLQGITGSGKTEVYKRLAKSCLDKNLSVIVLTPEIALTPQLISEFSSDFSDVIVTHSHMTEAQRHAAWTEALHSKSPRVIIGPRSALFLPISRIGAIIVDESHEPSYKQEKSPRYSALRLASVLGSYHKAKVVFGSATPLVSDRYIAEQADAPIVYMNQSAKSIVKPVVELIDMKQRDGFAKHRFLSDALLHSIEENARSKKQTLIFHNRRGSAQSTLCDHCGWVAHCPRCYLPLTLHGDTFKLICHTCGHHEKVPSMCPVCHQTNIIHKGIGTKLIEDELRRLFPKLRIARFDSDTAGDERIEKQYSKLYDGSIDIAIGTQVVAKGLDLPHLRTVGVIQADSGLILPDFGADERVFQLLCQVVGRVGRNEHQTNIVIQTYQPTHPAIQLGMRQSYDEFYRYEIKKRKQAHFPPFVYLLKLTCIYKSEAAVIRAAKSLAEDIVKTGLPIEILGPTPAFRERVADSYRWQITVKSKKRQHLLDVLTILPPTHWQFELDPTSLLS